MTTDTQLRSAMTANIAGSPFKHKGVNNATGVYDYVFTGAGCAAFSLLMHLKEAGLLQDKKVLVIDRDAKSSNDRTWCFWEKEFRLFESIVFKSWEQLHFYANNFSGPLQIEPYRYKLIRGIDFYNYCFSQLQHLPQIEWLQAPVESIVEATQGAVVKAAGQSFQGRYIFNSILNEKPPMKPDQYWLLQHFKGWIIETPDDVFDAGKATLMDFRVGQEQGCAFVYVLPFSKRRALVEYTLFSKELLARNAYDAALQDYLKRFLNISQYKVAEEEFGVIPMTNFPFAQRAGSVCNIGTAGGHTKASSGYTFRFIQKHAAQITQSIKQHGHPFEVKPDASRFLFYDSVLLHILHHGKMDGATIFSKLFQKNKAATVLKFLDNETSIAEELKLISSLPTITFTKAALAHLAAKI